MSGGLVTIGLGKIADAFGFSAAAGCNSNCAACPFAGQCGGGSTQSSAAADFFNSNQANAAPGAGAGAGGSYSGGYNTPVVTVNTVAGPAKGKDKEVDAKKAASGRRVLVDDVDVDYRRSKVQITSKV